MDSTVWGSGLKALGNSVLILALCILNIAYAGQCTGIFDAPLQSHGRGIDLSWGVSIETDQAVLPTPRLNEAWYWKSCGNQECQASGSPSVAIELPAFITTESLFNLYQPAYASEQLFIDYVNEFNTAYIGSGSTVEIGGDYQFYAFKELTLDYGATVILAPGDYWVESLYLSTSAKINTKGGQVRLFVRDRLDARYQASINEDKNSSVLIVGWDQMSFDGSNTINASIYSASKINAGWATDFSGPLAADYIDFYSNVIVRNDNEESPTDLLNGLCSDYGPLPDGDADGWADGIDPDKNNDGVLDSQEGKVDPTDSGFGFRIVDDGYGNLVDTNQCTDAFSTGLQSFSERGWIGLQYGAQLLSSPSLILPSRYVSVPRWSSVASCEVGPCMASGVPSIQLPERQWPELAEVETPEPPHHWHRFNDRNRNRPKALVVRPFSDLTLESQADGLIGGDVQVLYKGTLTLQPGDYWFNSLQIYSNAKLLVEGEGTARVYVKNGVSVGYRSTVNDSSESDAAAKLLIVSYDDVYVANNTEVNAWIVADGMVSSSGRIKGGISASRIALWPFATVTYDYPALWKTDFSVHCDIDNDGEYDLFDEDRDNDGISNEYEKELGFDPTDPEHTPPDMDGDGIPDLLDDDRDGDGVNNNEDVFPDDRTEWADMDGDGIGDNSDPDRDGDNFSNEEEIQQGTDPNDATDYPDIIAPTVEFNELISLTSASAISVNALAEDEYSGLKSVVLKNTTTGEEIEMTLDAGNEFLASIGLAEGNNILVVTATDNWNNQTSAEGTVNKDSTAPSLKIAAPQTFAIKALQITFTLSIEDENSGIQSVSAQNQKGTEFAITADATQENTYSVTAALTEGSNTLTFSAVDNAGNKTVLSQSVLSDVSAPEFSQPQVPSLTNQAEESVSIFISDRYSDIANASLSVNTEIVPASLASSGNGVLLTAVAPLQEADNALVFRATDALGNSASVSFVINRDSTSPELALTAPAAQWQAEDQYQLTGTVTDENSGLASVLFGSALLTVTDNAFSTVTTLTEGLNTLTVKANDIAGNSSAASIVVGWDNTAPLLTLDQNPTLITNNSQWDISGSASDAHSGVASLVIAFADGKQQRVTVTEGVFATSIALTEGQTEGELVLTDIVGHRTRQAFSVLLDQVAPELTLSFNNEPLSESKPVYVNQASQTVSLQMADESSGLASTTARLNDTELTITTQSTELALTLVTGENTLTVSVTDVAGNQSTQTVSFILDTTPPAINWLTDTAPTNSTSVTARWQATDANGISDQQLLLNNESLEVTEGDDYFEAALTLKEGQNRLALTVSDTAGNAASLQHTLVLDTQPPELTLNAIPATTAQSSINVSGQVSDGLPIEVLINGQAADVSEQGTFTAAIALAEGSNDIIVQASDALANLTQQSVSIVSDRTGPVINASVAATVEEEILTLTGSVSDALSAVKTVTVQNQTTGLPYQVNLSGDQFSADVVLEDGINELLITAVDELGNENTVSLSTELILDRLVWTWLTDASQPTTEASIILEGLLETELATSEFTIKVAGQTATVSRWSEGVYSVRSAVLELALGNNSFNVVATAANAEMTDSINIERVESDEVLDTTFNLTVSSPANGLQVSGEYITVSGTVEADSTPTVSINGDPVSLTTSLPYYYFTATLQIPQGENNFTVSIVAQSAGGATDEVTRTLYLDTTAPVLTLNNTLLAYPESTLVIENPYTLSGRVSDANFSSLTLNGKLVSITPTSDDEYQFSTGLSLPNNAETQIELIAQDSAGNRTTQTYLLNAQRSVELSWLLPTADSQLITYGEGFDVQVILQSTEVATSNQYQIRLINDTNQTSGDWVTLSFTNGIASTDLTLDGRAGKFRIEARVINAEGNVIASAQPRAFAVNEPASVPVELTKVQPEQGATHVDTKETVSLFFNQSIDANLLTVNLYETAYGKTWISEDDAGTEFFNAQGHQLVDVERDYEPMPLSWQLTSDGKTVLITLGREPAYNATLFVEVEYDGASFARYQYQTEALPTLVTLVVRDQYNRDVSNLRVTFAGQTGTTNSEGLVQFGYNDDEPLATGNYTLWANPGLTNASYGETKRTIAIDGGRLNDLGVIPVSFLNPEIGGSYLRSGQNQSLVGGEVLMDLTNAQVTFANGKTQGSVHVQFNTQNYNYPTHPFADPAWVFSFQPQGIRLTGDAHIQLKFPKYQNSWEYLPDNGTLMLLAAVNPSTEQIEPVGLVERQGSYAKVLNSKDIDVLDHLGVIQLPEEFEPILVQYRNQEISFTVMMTRLAALAQEHEPTLKERE